MKSEFRRLMEEDREAAKQLLIKLMRKLTTKQICQQIGLSSTRALYLIKKDLGLLREKFAPTDEELNSMSPRQLAKAYNVSLQRVYGYIRERRMGPRDEKNVGPDSGTGEGGSGSVSS